MADRTTAPESETSRSEGTPSSVEKTGLPVNKTRYFAAIIDTTCVNVSIKWRIWEREGGNNPSTASTFYVQPRCDTTAFSFEQRAFCVGGGAFCQDPAAKQGASLGYEDTAVFINEYLKPRHCCCVTCFRR